MISSMREYFKGLKFILVIIVVAFVATSVVYFGTGNSGSSGTPNIVGTVNGEEISTERFRRTQANLIEQYERMTRQRLTPEMIERLGPQPAGDERAGQRRDDRAGRRPRRGSGSATTSCAPASRRCGSSRRTAGSRATAISASSSRRGSSPGASRPRCGASSPARRSRIWSRTASRSPTPRCGRPIRRAISGCGWRGPRSRPRRSWRA